jgi:D-amino peptidase
MRVYISADIEGTTGQVSWKTCGMSDLNHPDFAYARRMMTHDVNAAIRGARLGGATRVVVKDSHGTSRNLFIDELEPDVELISGTGAHPDGMMTGVGEGFDCAMLIGYHGMAGANEGVMEHTISGGVHRFILCGEPAGEMSLSAMAAGEHGVPIVAVSSDDAGCREASALFPGVHTAVVKYGYGRYMARCLHPSQSAPLIERAATQGVRDSHGVKPWTPRGKKLDCLIEFNRQEHADFACRMPGARKDSAYGVTYEASTTEELHRAARMLMALAGLGDQG